LRAEPQRVASPGSRQAEQPHLVAADRLLGAVRHEAEHVAIKSRQAAEVRAHQPETVDGR
jgi:hypothetical protein